MIKERSAHCILGFIYLLSLKRDSECLITTHILQVFILVKRSPLLGPPIQMSQPQHRLFSIREGEFVDLELAESWRLPSPRGSQSHSGYWHIQPEAKQANTTSPVKAMTSPTSSNCGEQSVDETELTIISDLEAFLNEYTTTGTHTYSLLPVTILISG